MSTNFAKIRSSATFATLAEAGELASPEAAEAFSNTKFDYVIIGMLRFTFKFLKLNY